MSKIVPCQNPVHPYSQRPPKKPLELLLQYVIIRLIKPEARWAIMSEANQEDLEHGQDHPTTTEIPDFDEMWIKSLYEKLNKSASLTDQWLKEQDRIWGITNEEK